MPGFKKEALRFISTCRICSFVKPEYVNAHLKPFLLDAPLQLVATDYVGPLPSDRGYRYMLVIIDAFSRFPEVYPVKDMTVSTLLAAFRDYFARYGFPDALLSDRGTASEPGVLHLLVALPSEEALYDSVPAVD